jgi:XTP/dITP diphosphohydrolase
MPLIFATHNPNKTKEMQALLPGYKIKSLADLNYHQAIAETGTTLAENARLKAKIIFSAFGQAVFADDTGLEVEALNGAPGVYSARYAGPKADAKQNMQKLQRDLAGQSNRKAQFRTVISYLNKKGQVFLFEGCVKGEIIEAQAGEQGFGYDPIFMPLGYNQTFAQMPPSLKNKISHRALAMQKLIDFLQEQKN